MSRVVHAVRLRGSDIIATLPIMHFQMRMARSQQSEVAFDNHSTVIPLACFAKQTLVLQTHHPVEPFHQSTDRLAGSITNCSSVSNTEHRLPAKHK